MTNTMSAGGPSQLRSYPFKRSPPTPSGHDGGKVVTELREVLNGSAANVLCRKDEQFTPASQIYNGAIECFAYAVVQPRNAEDVSKTINFCRKNDLQLSVKAGGTGVHGQSIGGHIVLDMALLNDVAVDLPDSGPTLYESFRNHVESCNLTRAASGDSFPFVDPPQLIKKRSANDALGEEGGVGDMGRQKMDSNGDVEMRSPAESSTPSSSTLWTRSNSTPGTSLPSDASKSSRQSSDPTYRVGRTTYVNPSPTTSSSFPYVPTSFGGASASGSEHQSSFSNPLISGQHPVLNINSDAPPYAIITFGTGVHSKQLDKVTSTSPYGAFHVPTSAFPVGAGQFLLGGFGFLGRKYGLAMDNVVEAEVVLADGRIVWLGAEGHKGEFKDGENPDDLWWAIRGAGSSLGVVTRLRAKAYYLPSVYAGNFIYKFNPATTPSLLRHVRDCVKGSPRSLYTNIIMTAGPPGTPAIVAIQLCFSGSRSEGEQYVQNIGSWSEDRCLFQDFSERSFSRQQLAVEEILRDGSGRKWYIKSDMLSSLDDDIIEKTCDRFPGVPDGCTWLFEYTGGGAVADFKDSCLPAAHRVSQFTVAALHQSSRTGTETLDARCVSTAEEWIREVIHPNSAGGPLPCFIQTPDEVPGAYGTAYPRLQATKQTFDPTNFIKHAMWPGAPSVSGEPEHEGDKNPYGDVKKGKQREISALPRSSGTGENTPHDEAHKRTRLPSEGTFLTDDIVLPDGQPTAGLDTPTPQIPTRAPGQDRGDEGLAQTRLEAIRSTPLSGVREHRDNIPSQNMNMEETVKAAASSA